MPAQTVAEAQTHATFEALLWAFAHPGRLRTLEGEDAFARIAACLLDLEPSAHSADPGFERHLRDLGVRIAPLERAEYVFFNALEDVGVLHRVARGSALSPEDAATLVIPVRLEQTNLETNDAQHLRLTGPGINGALEVSVGGLPSSFWRVRAEVMAFPIGWDAFLVEGARVMGLPRTTHAEVV